MEPGRARTAVACRVSSGGAGCWSSCWLQAGDELVRVVRGWTLQGQTAGRGRQLCLRAVLRPVARPGDGRLQTLQSSSPRPGTCSGARVWCSTRLRGASEDLPSAGPRCGLASGRRLAPSRRLSSSRRRSQLLRDRLRRHPPQAGSRLGGGRVPLPGLSAAGGAKPTGRCRVLPSVLVLQVCATLARPTAAAGWCRPGRPPGDRSRQCCARGA